MRIRVQNFGGLVPKAQPRALPDNAAQTATNILATTTEFRPHTADTTVVASSGQTNPGGLYRLARKADGTFNSDFTTGWKVDAGDVNYVKFPINDNLKEWTAKSFNDGSSAPHVIDVDGGDRQLGVPAPTLAPAAVTNVVAQFSVQDRSTGVESAIQQAVVAIKGHLIPNYFGAAVPAGGGYYARTAANSFDPENPTQFARVFKLSGAGGTITDSYTSIPVGNFSWAFDPALAPFAVTISANHYIAIAYSARGLCYAPDSGAMTTGLAAILMPGKSDGTKFFTSGQVTALVAQVVEFLDPTNPQVDAMIQAIDAKASEVQALLDGGARASLAAVTQAYYGDAGVTAAITAAIAAAAEACWQAADSVVHSGTYVDTGMP